MYNDVFAGHIDKQTFYSLFDDGLYKGKPNTLLYIGKQEMSKVIENYLERNLPQSFFNQET